MFVKCECDDTNCGIQFLKINDSCYKIQTNSYAEFSSWADRLRALFFNKVFLSVFDVNIPQKDRSKLVEIRQYLWEDFGINPDWADMSQEVISPDLTIDFKIKFPSLKVSLFFKLMFLFVKGINFESTFVKKGDVKTFEAWITQ